MYLFLKFLIYLAIYTQSCQAYIYPIICEKCKSSGDAHPKHTSNENNTGSEFITDIVNNIIVPINNGLCNVIVNFKEVYECILSKYYQNDNAADEKAFDVLEEFLIWIGIASKEEPQSKCSYYSITIVTGASLMLFGLLYSTKKMVDYFREEEYLDLSHRVSFNKTFNICTCKLNNIDYGY